MALNVYTASAGSGKTHTLTREYLRLALAYDNTPTFQGIQAVTFTNKATAEMKERIIEELHRLSVGPKDSPFFKELTSALSVTETKLKERATKTLRALLLNYTDFRVRTIDSFFQEIIRSFAHELGYSGNMRLELDAKSIIHEAVVEVLADQDTSKASNSSVQSWITSLAEESMESGRGYRIEQSMSNFALQLEVEAVKLLRQNHSFPKKEDIKELQEELKTIIDELRKKTLELCHEIKAIFDELKLPQSEYKRGNNPILGIIECIKAGGDILESPSKGFYCDQSALPKLATSEDPISVLFSKEKRKEHEAIVAPKLPDIISLIEKFRELCHSDEGKKYMTAVTIYNYLGLYGLLIDIDTKLQELKQTEGTMLLADAPSLIASLLKDVQTDAPFLYEKIGTRIHHHMIDEFQDTSTMQYGNFRPLLQNAMAEGSDCLIVGDAKQSIYRFRSSDSSLLTTTLARDFPKEIKHRSLKENWRSTPEIIEFNNKLYPLLLEQIKSIFKDQIKASYSDEADPNREALEQSLQTLLSTYTDIEQTVPKQKADAKGLVALYTYTGKKTNKKGDEEGQEEARSEDDALSQLPHIIIDLQRRGYRPNEIAILVRERKNAAAVAEALQSFPREELGEYSLDFISQDALSVSNSPYVRFIIAALAYIGKGESDLQLAILEEAYGQLLMSGGKQATPTPLPENILLELQTIGRRGLYEAAEAIIHLFHPVLPEGEDAYIVCLLDMLYSWEAEQTADISTFLDYWDEKGASQTIVTPTNERALTLMTIHKSKGLGFPVVLLPDLNWKLDENAGKDKILWCSIEGKGLPARYAKSIPSVPIRYSAYLQHTYFAGEYYEEQMHSTFDALNLLYVATTRAKEELHIWVKKESDTSSNKNSSSTSLGTINRLFARKLDDTPLRELLIDGITNLQEGTPTTSAFPQRTTATKATPGEDTLRISSITSYPIIRRISVLRKGLEYFTEEKQRAYGHTMHLILSEIKTGDDIDTALEHAVSEENILPEEVAELSKILQEIVSTPECKHWFDGTGQVRNETPILGGGLKGSKRPDRIVFYDDDHVEIIDYKFGHYDKHYSSQVQEYIQLVQRMGYNDVRGFLCYIDQKKVKVVPVSLPNSSAKS